MVSFTATCTCASTPGAAPASGNQRGGGGAFSSDGGSGSSREPISASAERADAVTRGRAPAFNAAAVRPLARRCSARRGFDAQRYSDTLTGGALASETQGASRRALNTGKLPAVSRVRVLWRSPRERVA
jgi:hypothetical protein